MILWYAILTQFSDAFSLVPKIFMTTRNVPIVFALAIVGYFSPSVTLLSNPFHTSFPLILHFAFFIQY